jgi:hypothetical protein
MPGLNRNGPEGQGPKTGRGLGRCHPDSNEKSLENIMDHINLSARQRFGLGRNFRRSFGRGIGNW